MKVSLLEYVLEHCYRGECQCGRCFDHNPTGAEPVGHTADLVFFKVSPKGVPTKEEFLELVSSHKSEWVDVNPLDGQEHGYMELGGWIGDQGVALMTMGLGSLLGAWKLLTPRSVLGDIVDDALAMQMAGMGMVSIKAES